MGLTVTNRKSRGKREKVLANTIKINNIEVQIDRLMRNLKNRTWVNGNLKQTFVSTGGDRLVLETTITQDEEQYVEAWCLLSLNGKYLLTPDNYKEKKKEVIEYIEKYFQYKPLFFEGGYPYEH